MNTLYVLPDGGMLYAPDRPLDQSTAAMLHDRLAEYHGKPPPRDTLIWGEPVMVVDLRTPEPTVPIVEVDAPARMAALGFPDYDYLP